MKKLSEAAKYIIAGVLSLIAALFTFIFSEKKSINKHEKLVDMDRQRRAANSVDTCESTDFSVYISKYANELHIPKSKRGFQKILNSVVEYRFPCALTNPFEFFVEIVSRNGRILELSPKTQFVCIISLDGRNKRPILAKIEPNEAEVIITGVCSKGGTRDMQKLIKHLEKSCRRTERSEARAKRRMHRK